MSTSAYHAYSMDYTLQQRKLHSDRHSGTPVTYESGDYIPVCVGRGLFCLKEDIDLSIGAVEREKDRINRSMGYGGEGNFTVYIRDITQDGDPEIVMVFEVDGIYLSNTWFLYAYRVQDQVPSLVLRIEDKDMIRCDFDAQRPVIEWKEAGKWFRANWDGARFVSEER
jgi:hypothetical protein